MPWGKPHEFVCVECGAVFTSVAINPLRCPECRPGHNKARIMARYRKKRGKMFGKRAKNKPLSEAARFNLFMEKTWRNAKCPECGKHMSVCECCEPAVRHVVEAAVDVFDPLALPVPAVCASGDDWEPWK